MAGVKKPKKVSMSKVAIRLRDKLAAMDEFELEEYYVKKRESMRQYRNAQSPVEWKERAEKEKKRRDKPKEKKRLKKINADKWANKSEMEKKKINKRTVALAQKRRIANPPTADQIAAKQIHMRNYYYVNRERIIANRRSRRAADRAAGVGSAKPERKVEVMLLNAKIPFVNNDFKAIPRGLGTEKKSFRPDFRVTTMVVNGVLIIVEIDENQRLGYWHNGVWISYGRKDEGIRPWLVKALLAGERKVYFIRFKSPFHQVRQQHRDRRALRIR